jgi:phenylalanyl-tRNA synthetase beta chain
MRVVVENERQRLPDLHAFEIGAVHEWRDGEPLQTEVLGLVLAGRDRPPTHDRLAAAVDVALAKGLLEQLAARLAWCRLTYERAVPRDGVEHPGRTALIRAVRADGEGVPVGRVGEVHPSLLQAYGVHTRHVVFAHIDLDAFRRLVPRRLRVGRLEHLPGVERDIALVVPEEQAAGEVEAVIREAGGQNLRAVTLVDQYRGAPLAADEKSLAYRLRFEFVEEGESEEGVAPAIERLVAVLSERLGARLRS